MTRNLILMVFGSSVVALILGCAPALASSLAPQISAGCPDNICDVTLFYEYYCGSGTGCNCVTGGDNDVCKSVL